MFFRNIATKITLRVIVRKPLHRTIMTTSDKKCEKVLEEIKTANPFYEKYAEKIAKLQQTSPEELLGRVEDLEKKKKKTPSEMRTQPQEVDVLKAGKFSQLLKPKEPLSGPSQVKNKSLEDIMKVDLIKDKSTEEIKEIWETYHRQKPVIAGTIPSKEYEKLESRGAKFPTFILPLPRSKGYEFILCQFQNNSVHFTPLLYFQVHKDNAPECLSLTYYTEFKDEKGIVLMRGEYDTNIIDAKEALCLANELLLYYGQDNEEKLKLLETFNKQPDNFKHVDLIKQIESLSL